MCSTMTEAGRVWDPIEITLEAMPCTGAESEDSDRPVAMLQLWRCETSQISYFQTILRLYEAIIKQNNMIPRYF